MKALDLFAGTGWGVACQWLGIEEDGVDNMPEVVATREANGMTTIFNDVWDGLNGTYDVGEYDILIASPPCQTFSLAGNGKGRQALDRIREIIKAGEYKDVATLQAIGEENDPRTALILTPLAYAVRDLPTYIVFEQVPPALPVWEACADALRAHGYSVVTGCLNAEQYGVPQTRRRAILIARRDGVEAAMPTPTHSRYYAREPERLDEGVLPWVSMADALGWGRTDAPSHTITAGATHGPDRWASGGASVRKVMDSKVDGPDWKPRETVPTAEGKVEYPNRFGIEEVATLQSYPTFRAGHRPKSAQRPLTHPAPTIIAGHDTANRGFSDDSPRGVRTATPEEVAAFQSYPPFVWCGSKNKQNLQIGNAVPPLLAKAILSVFLA